jgi:hypothetical protein
MAKKSKSLSQEGTTSTESIVRRPAKDFVRTLCRLYEDEVRHRVAADESLGSGPSKQWGDVGIRAAVRAALRAASTIALGECEMRKSDVGFDLLEEALIAVMEECGMTSDDIAGFVMRQLADPALRESRDDRIGQLYDELGELTGKLADAPDNEELQATIRERFEELRGLQEQEARTIRLHYGQSLSLPIGAGEDLLSEANRMLGSNAHTSEADDATSRPDDSPAPP